MAIDELIERIRFMGNPSVIGLDPRLDLIPKHILSHAFDLFNQTLAAGAYAVLEFNKALIDELYDIVPAVKPQIAMYEIFGAEGIKSYIDTISYAKKKGLMVIGDIKRGDIASTADAYADSHLGRVKVGETEIEVYAEDFATLNPYLGEDSIEPFLRNCRNYSKGVFVLVKTSNPTSSQLQDLCVGRERLYEAVGNLVSDWGKDLIGKYGYSEVGAVVGATHPSVARSLRALMPHALFLAPGYGAQGAKAADIADGSIVNSSRGVIAAYQREPYNGIYEEEGFAKAARAAAKDMREDLKCLKT
ncbi:MAG: orotidine-5'-phosphate decarboxylase [Clostridiales bacterium]|nr:orotidine-5'-phosphate decarboxylase [Clostridiales bacterium]